MGFEPTQEEMEVLATLRPDEDVERLAARVERLEAVLAQRAPEVLVPAQSLADTLTELKDVILLVLRHAQALQRVGYDQAEQDQLVDAVVTAMTFNELFAGRMRGGGFRTLTVEQVVEASRPWRARLSKAAGQAFFFEPALKAVFENVNTSRTVEEEVSDLRTLLLAARENTQALQRVGYDPAQLHKGERLLADAEGRDNVAILGIRSQSDLKLKRDRHLTLAVNLGRYARAAGLNALQDDPTGTADFERVTFRNALRRLRGAGRSTSSPQTDENAPNTPPTS